MKGLKFLLFFTIVYFNGMLPNVYAVPLSNYENGDFEKDDYYEKDDIYPSDPHEDDYYLEETKNTYKCPKEEKIISYTYLCDTIADCADATDEDPEICRLYKSPDKDETKTTAYINPSAEKSEEKKDYGYKEYEYKDYLLCTDDFFKCPSLPGLCVPLRSLCDGFEDCPDGEDELSCGGETTTRTSPSSAKVQQVNSSTASVDDINTTSYMKPAAFSGTSNDLPTTVSHRSVSITESHPTVTVAPNIKANLTTKPSCNLGTEFECRSRSGDCVSKILLCDGYLDCNDGSDEENCDCGETGYRCISGRCIPAQYHCDGFNDCGDHSDEIIGCSPPALGKERSTETNESFQTLSKTPLQTTTSSTPTIPLSETTTSEKPDATPDYVRQCQRNICKNGGTCFLRQNKEYFCECTKGFSGSSCQISENCSSGENCDGNHSITLHKDSFALTISLSFIVFLWQRLLCV